MLGAVVLVLVRRYRARRQHTRDVGEAGGPSELPDNKSRRAELSGTGVTELAAAPSPGLLVPAASEMNLEPAALALPNLTSYTSLGRGDALDTSKVLKAVPLQPDYSAFPEVVQLGPEVEELQALQARHSKLEEEQQLILRLQQIRSEQGQLQQRISEISGSIVGQPS